MVNIDHIQMGFNMGTLDSLFKECFELANEYNTKVFFKFNGVPVIVTKHSDYLNLDKVFAEVRTGNRTEIEV